MSQTDDRVQDFRKKLSEKGLGPLDGSWCLVIGARSWTVRKEAGRWDLVEGSAVSPKATFTMDEETFMALMESPGQAAPLFLKGRIRVDRLPFAMPLLYQLRTLAS